MANGFSQVATVDVLTVLAYTSVRCDQRLSHAGVEVDLRRGIQQDFDHVAARTKDIDPTLPEHTPDYDQQSQALQYLFWHLYDQAEKNLRVHDNPAGEA